ncbi:MAG: hypothetical protein ACRCXZ_06665 [Patescibacteria group bacterium]
MIFQLIEYPLSVIQCIFHSLLLGDDSLLAKQRNNSTTFRAIEIAMFLCYINLLSSSYTFLARSERFLFFD